PLRRGLGGCRGRSRRRLLRGWRLGCAVGRLVATLAAALGGHAGFALLGLQGGGPPGLGLVLGPAGLGLGVLGPRSEVGLGGGSAGVATRGYVAALLDGVGQDAAHQAAGPDGVIV